MDTSMLKSLNTYRDLGIGGKYKPLMHLGGANTKRTYFNNRIPYSGGSNIAINVSYVICPPIVATSPLRTGRI